MQALHGELGCAPTLYDIALPAYITYLWKRIQAAPLLSTLLLVPSSELSV